MTLADRIVVMRAGLIEQIGSPMEIYSNPINEFVADFFGSPSMNLVPGEVRHEGGKVLFKSPSLTLALPERMKNAPAGKATLGIRPEHVAIRRDGGGEIEHIARLVEPLGKDTLIYFDLGGERPFVSIAEGLALATMRPGEKVNLSLTAEHLYLFGADGKRFFGEGTQTVAPIRHTSAGKAASA